jgi:hypothetical protein
MQGMKHFDERGKASEPIQQFSVANAETPCRFHFTVSCGEAFGLPSDKVRFILNHGNQNFS